MAVNFLTSWDIKLNLRDRDGGLTPLHLGVVSGNSKIVRKLLIRGADKNCEVNIFNYLMYFFKMQKY